MSGGRERRVRSVAYSVAATVDGYIADSVVDAVTGSKRCPGKAIWLCSGARLASTLFSAGFVDEVVLKLNPVLFGSGIPLVGRGIDPTTRLHLLDTFVHPSGHVRLHYRVEN
jgi:dihydrofolate reductase